MLKWETYKLTSKHVICTEPNITKQNLGIRYDDVLTAKLTEVWLSTI